MLQLMVLLILVVDSFAPQVAVIERIGSRPLTRAHLSFIIKLQIPPHVTYNIEAAKTLTQKNRPEGRRLSGTSDQGQSTKGLHRGI